MFPVENVCLGIVETHIPLYTPLTDKPISLKPGDILMFVATPFLRFAGQLRSFLDGYYKSYQMQGFTSCSTIKTKLLRLTEGHFTSMSIVSQCKIWSFLLRTFSLQSHW